MRVKGSFSLFLFLALVGGGTLSKCAFVSGNDPARALELEKEKASWPRTHILVFDVQDEHAPISDKGMDILGPNMSFTTPTCTRLKMSAEQSGETYVGHMMRQRMHFGPCRSIALRQEKNIWNWPWAHGVPRADLPPTMKGKYGAWDLRCADLSEKSRCALVQTIKPKDYHGARITTHFTMAVVRGKAMPVWRVWIPRVRKNWFRGLNPEGVAQWERMLTSCIKSPQSFTTCLNAARAKFTDRRTNEILFSVQHDRRNLNFTKCVDEGCMVETPIDLSAKAYASLVRGKAVAIKLHPLGNMPLDFKIMPEGFHEAFEAFSNVDQTENSVHATDKRKAL